MEKSDRKLNDFSLNDFDFFDDLCSINLCHLQNYAFDSDYFTFEWCSQNAAAIKAHKNEVVANRTRKAYMEYYSVPKDLNTFLERSDAIKDINPEFVEDVQLILKKFETNVFVTRNIMELVSLTSCS